nr:ADP-ribosyl cyclase/cyclic ADP-ribose hydrolase 1 [Loxodonta africana]
MAGQLSWRTLGRCARILRQVPEPGGAAGVAHPRRAQPRGAKGKSAAGANVCPAFVSLQGVSVCALCRESARVLQKRIPGGSADKALIQQLGVTNPRKDVAACFPEKNCKEIWKAFKNSFISKDPCSITEEDYLPLMKLTNQTVPCHQTLFWSKIPTLARQLFQDQRKVFSLEDLLLGSITGGLTWCGSRGTSEMNYQSCPDWRKDCSNNPVSVFWKTASKKFAADACGEVLALLNGSIPEPFDRNSIFGSVEILNLNSKAVHLLQAWVIHDAGDSRDSCLSSSINDLKSIITERNIRFTCQKEYR